MSEKRRAVITGIGAVTPLGVGARPLHEQWSQGVGGIEVRSGRRPVTAMRSTRPSI